EIDPEAGKAYVKLNMAERLLTSEKMIGSSAYLTTGLGPQKSIASACVEEENEALLGGLVLSGQKITDLVAAFQANSALFKETGGVHSSALSDGEKIIASFDDIGRHNALDKVIGFALKEGLDLNKYVLLTSGRVPGYMAYKCYHAGLPFVVSRAAVTAAAVDFAKKTGMTLIGFARNSCFNIYSGEERVLVQK
ncbi:MAG: formate dehydrogenase accessory sulfurtransferase FdhD, partial [Eubacteriales bacterium]|nr:formate dehydrogenase accessory sulfurtransferase FdhD [Eubacteriales bacterium]